jgi:hypothetical protein
MYGERHAYKFLMGKPSEKRPLGRRWHRCDIGINIDLQAVGLGGMDWMDLNQDGNGWQGVVKVVRNRLLPNGAGNFVTN